MIKEVMTLIENDRIEEAYELARKCDLCLYEVWEDGEIIGIQVEDDIVYFDER